MEHYSDKVGSNTNALKWSVRQDCFIALTVLCTGTDTFI